MSNHEPSPSQATLLVTGVAGVFFGALVGYLIANQQHLQRQLGTVASAPPFQSAPAAPGASPAPALFDEREAQTYREILARDPRNVTAAINLGNMFYDAGRYAEAIPYYQQALTIEPGNASVSTDLGTALWYSGRPDEALTQYARSLEVSPDHAQTLFNIGIVRLEGKQDSKGAVESWERLLATSPGYPEATRVRQLIDRAKQSVQTAASGG